MLSDTVLLAIIATASPICVAVVNALLLEHTRKRVGAEIKSVDAKVVDLKIQTDGKMNELLSLSKDKAHAEGVVAGQGELLAANVAQARAEGVAEGQEKERDRKDAPDEAPPAL